ncbi:MAG: FMN-binding protein [Candidatus Marinimicrobia bacterium]|nr:FMN-binding protein [Candidatus Neomarinimicrobiota bacterium]
MCSNPDVAWFYCRLNDINTWKGQPAEVIVNSVIREQSLKVNAITGATLSSAVILKTIQLALEQGLNPPSSSM